MKTPLKNTHKKLKLNTLLALLTILTILLNLSSCNDSKNNTVDEKTIVTSEDKSTKPSPENSFKQYSAADFFKTTTVFGSSINHKANAVLVTSDASGVFNAYRYPLDGSKPSQMTFSTKNSTFGVSWFPEDDRILFTSDQGGNELNHVFVQQLNGEIKDLTPGDKLKAGFASWSNDHQYFYILSNERDPRGFDLYRYSVKDYHREMVFENKQSWSIGSISPDGHWLSLNKPISNANNNIFLVDLTTTIKEPLLITPHQGNVSYQSYTFTPDSKNLILGSNEAGEFNQAFSYDLGRKTLSPYFKADWDVSFVYFSNDGKYRVIGVNADAQTKLTITEVATGKNVPLPELPQGDLRGINFSDDSSVMAFYVNADDSPSNLFSYRFGDNKVHQLTLSLNPEMKQQNLVTSEVKHFKSFDGLEIPGLLYRPIMANSKHKVPALIWVHGGPGGQSRKGYRASIQHLVNHGYAIFAVNNRGSSGYGKTFFHLDDKKHGEDDLQDIVYGKKYLQTLDWVDKDKIGIIGGSYGGYMTMAAMAFTDEFKVGIDIFGVTNWERTLKSIPPWWESFKKSLYDEMGDPATDSVRHRKISPLFHAENIKNPVLIIQGVNDPRVLKIESDEMVAAIKKNNVPVEYILFDDEGHGFTKKKNRITASEAFVTFLNKYLK